MWAAREDTRAHSDTSTTHRGGRRNMDLRRLTGCLAGRAVTWQHPFVSVFKQFGAETGRDAKHEGDVMSLLVRPPPSPARSLHPAAYTQPRDTRRQCAATPIGGSATFFEPARGLVLGAAATHTHTQHTPAYMCSRRAPKPHITERSWGDDGEG